MIHSLIKPCLLCVTHFLTILVDMIQTTGLHAGSNMYWVKLELILELEYVMDWQLTDVANRQRTGKTNRSDITSRWICLQGGWFCRKAIKSTLENKKKQYLAHYKIKRRNQKPSWQQCDRKKPPGAVHECIGYECIGPHTTCPWNKWQRMYRWWTAVLRTARA